jgi:hypothetical protein
MMIQKKWYPLKAKGFDDLLGSIHEACMNETEFFETTIDDHVTNGFTISGISFVYTWASNGRLWRYKDEMQMDKTNSLKVGDTIEVKKVSYFLTYIFCVSFLTCPFLSQVVMTGKSQYSQAKSKLKSLFDAKALLDDNHNVPTLIDFGENVLVRYYSNYKITVGTANAVDSSSQPLSSTPNISSSSRVPTSGPGHGSVIGSSSRVPTSGPGHGSVIGSSTKGSSSGPGGAEVVLHKEDMDNLVQDIKGMSSLSGLRAGPNGAYFDKGEHFDAILHYIRQKMMRELDWIIAEVSKLEPDGFKVVGNGHLYKFEEQNTFWRHANSEEDSGYYYICDGTKMMEHTNPLAMLYVISDGFARTKYTEHSGKPYKFGSVRANAFDPCFSFTDLYFTCCAVYRYKV